MERLLHILDLDQTTVKVDVEPWIIKKTEPNVPIIRLRPGQRKLIESGTFRGDDHLISYCGREYWLSDSMYKELEKKTKKDVDLGDYGVSYAEFIDPELVAEQANKIKICRENLEHLFNTKDDVIIVSERSDLELHSDLIQSVRNSLAEFNITIQNVYMLSNNNLRTYTEDVCLKKLTLVIEKLVGFKIEGEKFTNVPVEQYNKVHVYDDDRKTFDEMKTIQETLNKIYFNSDDDMKGIVMNKILSFKPFVKMHHITGNEFNKFNIEKVILERPSRIHKFNYFK
jgi:hypothetical protein